MIDTVKFYSIVTREYSTDTIISDDFYSLRFYHTINKRTIKYKNKDYILYFKRGPDQ